MALIRGQCIGHNANPSLSQAYGLKLRDIISLFAHSLCR